MQDVRVVLILIVGVNQDIVNVYDAEDVKELAKDGLNATLETSWCVGQAERHDEVFEKSPSCPESRFPFVSFGDWYAMIGPLQVHFCKDFGRGELIKENVGGRNGVPILERNGVESTIVNAKLKFASFLWYKEYRRSSA